MYLSWHTKLSLWTPRLSSPLAQFPISFPLFVAQELWKPVLVLLRVAGVDSALAGRKVGGYNVMLVGRRAVDVPSICWKNDTEDLQWYAGCWKRTTPDYTSSPPDCTSGSSKLNTRLKQLSKHSGPEMWVQGLVPKVDSTWPGPLEWKEESAWGAISYRNSDAIITWTGGATQVWT